VSPFGAVLFWVFFSVFFPPFTRRLSYYNSSLLWSILRKDHKNQAPLDLQRAITLQYVKSGPPALLFVAPKLATLLVLDRANQVSAPTPSVGPRKRGVL
jgi:hypothetical protein